MDDKQTTGLYCGVLQKRLTKVQDRVCPLGNSEGGCMWVHRENGKCMFTSTHISAEEFCKRVAIRQPLDSEIELRRTRLKTLLKPLDI